MQSFLVVCRLEPAPAGKLPSWGGLQDAADEHGLLPMIFEPAGVRPLPEGMLWGRFEDGAAALAALDAALASASDLLGYPVKARGRAACPTEAASITELERWADSGCPQPSSSISIASIGFLSEVGGRG